MVIRISCDARFVGRIAVLSSLLMLAGGRADAQHRARLSADLTGYLTSGSSSIEVIVDGAAAADRLASRYNLKVTRHLHNGGVLLVNAGQLAALQHDVDVDHLSGNIRYKPSTLNIDPIDEGIGADQAWSGAGNLQPLSGRGITVAVIDSGIDPAHNALKGHVLATVDFTGGDGVDRFGHGTHVAAIIAGQPGILPDTRMYRGVAYGASIINLRVLGNDGSGSAADVIDAIDWAIDHAHAFNIRIINLSLGAPVLQSYRDDPVCAAVERAVRAGLVVVAAAGNYGRSADGREVAGSITSPGNSPFALTVGALDTKGTADRGDDEVASFSSIGPTQFDQVMKPDLVAPGRRITSAEAAGSVLSVNFPQQHVAGSGANAYIYGSGTSMAAAFVSGAAALVLEERPDLQPLAVKLSLEVSSAFLADAGLVRGGAGSLNVLGAADFAQNGQIVETSIAGGSVVAVDLFLGHSTQFFSQSLISSSKLFAIKSTKMARQEKRIESLMSKALSDSLVWGASDDSLVWGASDDSLVWGASDDSLVFGASDDSLVWGA